MNTIISPANVQAEVRDLNLQLRQQREALNDLNAEHDALCVTVISDDSVAGRIVSIREQIVIADAHIRGLQTLLGQKAVEKNVVDLEAQRQADAAELARKREVCKRLEAEIRELESRVEELQHPLQKAEEGKSVAQQLYTKALEDLSEHSRNRLPHGAPFAQVDRYKVRTKQLEDRVSKRLKERDAATLAWQQLASQFSSARMRRDELRGVLRINTPREDVEPFEFAVSGWYPV